MKKWALIEVDGEYKIIGDEWDVVVKLRSSFRSQGYDTKEELIEGQCILSEPCKICGGIVHTNFIDSVKIKLTEQNICYTCNFWSEKIDIKDNPRTVRVNGTHYWIEDDKPNAAFQGFGGSKFDIQFNDGRKVVTHNLWCQGDIPLRFRDLLPDNAIFTR
jgi:hypothetical protein